MSDILSEASITAGLGTRVVGRRVDYYPSVTSTMDVAREAIQRGAADGTAVIAAEQTAGRGRLKRSWLSPVGSIAVSLILYPDISQLPSMIMLSSLAVAYAIEGVTGLKCQIKWPNDVLINGKKICGILIETDVQPGVVKHVNIGIGINVNVQVADFPDIQSIATSLSDELGREVSRLDILRRLLIEADRLYLALKSGGSLYEAWRDHLVTLGKRVRVKAGETVHEGLAESVSRDGSLMLRVTDGSLQRITVGDVTLRV